MIHRLSITLVYAHADSGVVSLPALLRGEAEIAEAHVGGDAFLEATGALIMAQSRVFRFVDTHSGDELRSYMLFLLGALVSLHKPSSNEAPLPEALEALRLDISWGGRQGVLSSMRQEDDTRMLFYRRGPHKVAVSFLNPKGLAPLTHDSPFFDGLEMSTLEFRGAAWRALDEYFQLVTRSVKPHAESVLGELAAVWGGCREALRAGGGLSATPPRQA